MIDRSDVNIAKKLVGKKNGLSPVVALKKSNESFVIKCATNPWIGLHDGTVRDAISLAEWELQIPQYGCACRKDYMAYKAENPPDFSSPESIWLWGFNLHNWVNRKLGKPELTIDEARKIWSQNNASAKDSSEDLL